MCQRLTTLAHDESGHRIAQCEHGTIHLLWVRARRFLHPDMLLPLLALIQRWRPGQATASSHGFVLCRLPDGCVQLWYDCVGLLLREAELSALRDLLWQATEGVDLLERRPRQAFRRWSDEYRPLTVHPEDVEPHN